MLLSVDSAALGVWADGVLIRHKCLTGYTVRRKAGKAQMTYLRRCADLLSPDCMDDVGHINVPSRQDSVSWGCAQPAMRPFSAQQMEVSPKTVLWDAEAAAEAL